MLLNVNDVQTEGQLCTYQYISVKLGLVEIPSNCIP